MSGVKAIVKAASKAGGKAEPSLDDILGEFDFVSSAKPSFKDEVMKGFDEPEDLGALIGDDFDFVEDYRRLDGTIDEPVDVEALRSTYNLGISEYDYVTGGSKAVFVDINPHDFINATADSITKKDLFRNPVSPTLGAKGGAPMFLKVDKHGEIYNHEGRHRMAYLAGQGVESVPVALKFDHEVKSVDNLPLQLKGEEDQFYRSQELVPTIQVSNPRLAKRGAMDDWQGPKMQGEWDEEAWIEKSLKEMAEGGFNSRGDSITPIPKKKARVYHATDAYEEYVDEAGEVAYKPSFKEFENRDIGFHFAANPELAENAAKLTGKQGAKALEFDVDVSDFLEVKGSENGFRPHDLLEELHEKKLLDDTEFDDHYEAMLDLEDKLADAYVSDTEFNNAMGKYVADILLEKGVKGLKYYNEYDAYGEAIRFKDMPEVAEKLKTGVQPDWSYIVLDSKDIKSKVLGGAGATVGGAAYLSEEEEAALFEGL